MRFTFVIRRIARDAMGFALAVLLVGAVACGGNAASPSPVSSQTSSTSSTASPAAPPTLRPGDPPVYADAVARLQQYLDAWAAGDTAAKNAMLEPATQASSSVPDPQFLRGEIASYQPQQRVSDDDFTLLVDLQLHLPTANESAWGEGINSRFVTFKRANASSPFLMKFASSPPLALPE